ncbi:MAG: hypothetical protein COS85_14930 [Armatimonadetes bacterium CG07_land_8_20_14_0_80_59_28]|nr:MAG: hypothetical protein COS85_14930 [Armatimonadetes bacterium CG07_land_8_20_14_0_80_59_28]PIY38255.1 MAG: hypothetical protein COZ05_21015 [Armatimonadetes bacterium CG_4_10_14_3_um_filter_59_10]
MVPAGLDGADYHKSYLHPPLQAHPLYVGESSMTRFVYSADTHFGAVGPIYHQQNSYVERLPELIDCLARWIKRRGDINFVLHGGDMVNAGTAENIQLAAEGFVPLSPMHLSLGNHDLTEDNSLEAWLSQAPKLLCGGQPDYTIETEDCAVHIAPTQWCGIPYRWESELEPDLLPEQIERLRRSIEERSDVLHLLCTHSPVFDVPPAQTGWDDPFHLPPEGFTASVMSLVNRFPQLGCVMGAHSHVNMHVEEGGCHFVTVSAFSEAPFEFKVFEVAGGEVRMSTRDLAKEVEFEFTYDDTRAYAQGRECDRSFVCHPNLHR